MGGLPLETSHFCCSPQYYLVGNCPTGVLLSTSGFEPDVAFDAGLPQFDVFEVAFEFTFLEQDVSCFFVEFAFFALGVAAGSARHDFGPDAFEHHEDVELVPNRRREEFFQFFLFFKCDFFGFVRRVFVCFFRFRSFFRLHGDFLFGDHDQALGSGCFEGDLARLDFEVRRDSGFGRPVGVELETDEDFERRPSFDTFAKPDPDFTTAELDVHGEGGRAFFSDYAGGGDFGTGDLVERPEPEFAHFSLAFDFAVRERCFGDIRKEFPVKSWFFCERRGAERAERAYGNGKPEYDPDASHSPRSSLSPVDALQIQLCSRAATRPADHPGCTSADYCPPTYAGQAPRLGASIPRNRAK